MLRLLPTSTKVQEIHDAALLRNAAADGAAVFSTDAAAAAPAALATSNSGLDAHARGHTNLAPSTDYGSACSNIPVCFLLYRSGAV